MNNKMLAISRYFEVKFGLDFIASWLYLVFE